MSELKEIREKAFVNVREVIAQNKEKIEEAYECVMRLEYKARKEGLLALEYDAGFIPKELPLCDHITEMVEWIVNGTEPAVLSELLTLKFLANNYTGIDALLYFLYSRSMLMLQAGMSPWQIEDFFNAVVSGTGLVFQRKHNMWEEEKKQKIENWKNALTKKEKELLHDISKQLKDLSKEEWKVVVSCNGFYGFDKVLPFLEADTQELVKCYMNAYRYYTIVRMPEFVQEQELCEMAEELKEMINRLRNKEQTKGILDDVLKCSDEEIRLLMRNVDNQTLALALKGEKEDVADCFYRNLSIRLKYMLQEDMEYMGPVRRCDVEDAQKKIREIARNTLGW